MTMNPRTTAVLVLTLFVAQTFWISTSYGQGAGVDRTAAARALFIEGLERLDAEDWTEAADRFERALALRPSPQITYNLTTALVPLGHLVRASELLRQVSRDPTASSEVRHAAEARRQEILPRIASLTIDLDEVLLNARLFVDERPIDAAAIGVALPVDPGSHTISARVEGRILASSTITLEDSEERTVTLTPDVEANGADQTEVEVIIDPVEPDPPVEPTPPTSPPRRSIARQWWFWTIIGAVVVGGAITTGVLVGTQDADPADPIAGLGGTIYIGD